MKLTHFGKIDENGVMTITNRKIFDSDIKEFAGKEVKITIERKTKKRSIDQNDFYWGIVIPIVKRGLSDLGWQHKGRRLSDWQVHEMFKNSFLPDEIVNTETGEVIPIKASSAEITTTEFMEYIADIQQWSAEKGIYVPDPIFEKKTRFRGQRKELKKVA